MHEATNPIECGRYEQNVISSPASVLNELDERKREREKEREREISYFLHNISIFDENASSYSYNNSHCITRRQ